MKRNDVAVQFDLFNSAPVPPALPSSRQSRAELVALLAKLLLETVQIPADQSEIEEGNHDQDQC